MFGLIISKGLAMLLKFGLGGIIDKAMDHMQRRAELENDRDRVKTEAKVEVVKQIVAESKILADYNKAKLSFPWFWLFAAMFIMPLGLWWAAVLMDSIFDFDFQVADLPNAHMREWAGDMIKWIFFVGGGSAFFKFMGK